VSQFAAAPFRDCERLHPGGSSGEIIFDSKPEVSSLYFEPPPTDLVFWQGLLDLMRQTTSVIHWDGDDCTLLVADPAVIPHLSLEITESFGDPQVVTSAEDIIAAIERSTGKRLV
jgi:hypothetical protein